MNIEILKIMGQIAGIGGLSLGVILILFREIIKKNIYPKFKNEELAYRLLRLILFLAWGIAVIGVIAWAYVTLYNKKFVYTAGFSSKQESVADIEKPLNMLGVTDETDNSIYANLSEENLIRVIDSALNEEDVNKAIALLMYFKADETKKQEAKRVYDYCISNNMLDEATKACDLLTPFEKDEAMSQIALERMKGDLK